MNIYHLTDSFFLFKPVFFISQEHWLMNLTYDMLVVNVKSLVLVKFSQTGRIVDVLAQSDDKVCALTILF